MATIQFGYCRGLTVDRMKAWALRASHLTAGQCSEGEKIIEYMRMIERDNRRRCV